MNETAERQEKLSQENQRLLALKLATQERLQSLREELADMPRLRAAAVFEAATAIDERSASAVDALRKRMHLIPDLIEEANMLLDEIEPRIADNAAELNSINAMLGEQRRKQKEREQFAAFCAAADAPGPARDWAKLEREAPLSQDVFNDFRRRYVNGERPEGKLY